MSGIRKCAWCGDVMGIADLLDAGQVTHGICPTCAKRELDALVPVVKPHPQGGYTHAVAESPSRSIYQGWWRTQGEAARALLQTFPGDHARELSIGKLDRLGSHGAAPARLAALG